MYVLFYVYVFCVHLLQITRDRAQMQETSVSSKTTETQNLKAGEKTNLESKKEEAQGGPSS